MLWLFSKGVVIVRFLMATTSTTTTTLLPFGSYNSYVTPDQWHIESLSLMLLGLFALGIVAGILVGLRR
jgi:hypothetical protein